MNTTRSLRQDVLLLQAEGGSIHFKVLCTVRSALWRHNKKSCNGKGIDATDFSSRLPTVDDEDENMSSRKRYALADYTASVRMWTTRRRSDSGKEIIEVRICR